MATTFGTQPEDPLTNSSGDVLVGYTLELYATRSNAQTQTGLVASVVTGALGRWTYTDSLSRSSLYLRDPAGNIWAIESEESANGSILSDLTVLPAGSVFTVYWDGANWTYNGSTIASRPSGRADLTMIAVGGASGPSFGQVGVDLWLRDA
jgi:hypothetical protein